MRGSTIGYKIRRTPVFGRKKLVACIIMCMMVLLLCGCMKMHIDIVWNADNSAMVTYDVGITRATMSTLDMTEKDVYDGLKNSFPDDIYDVEKYENNEYVGIIATAQIEDITEDDGLDNLSFTCTKSGTKKIYNFSGRINGDAESLGMDFQISITMPGRITSHNADTAKGKTLTWDMTGGYQSIEATSETGGLAWLWIVLIVAVVAGGVVYLYICS